ncbi:ubiquinone biosynthesis accessory factor UbiJ [Thiobacter aerophilum]|uniref:Ubiquinone biosynthesis accessory factor UbiJ n=1 Tax=Thiobacter aerophilum TaxID=3121275 RepID=A0ABV0ECE3_9BURK
MQLAVSLLNHVLAQNPGARERLASFSGLCFALDGFPLPRFAFTITEDGSLAAPRGQAPDAVLSASPDALLAYLLVQPRDRSLIRIHGYHAFGEAVAEVLSGLEWEAEEDLARLFGDVLGHRLAAFGRAWWDWRLKSAQSLARALAEFLTEERPWLAKRADIERFAAEVASLAASVEQLEARIARLGGRG